MSSPPEARKREENVQARQRTIDAAAEKEEQELPELYLGLLQGVLHKEGRR